MTDKTKPVTMIDGRKAISACCDASKGAQYAAVPTFWAATGSLGYTLENDVAGCSCAPRFLPHNWRRAHAEFVSK